MATSQPTQQPTPPRAGARPSIRVDDQLAADLAVVMRTGINMSDAIRRAVGQLADQYRTAWTEGVVPVGTTPVVLAYQLQQDPALRQRPTRTPAPSSGYDARQQPSSHRGGRPLTPADDQHPTPRLPGPLPGVPVRRP
ncbi:hypothetical protein ACWEV4_02475 [Streptomyces sp. NPDC003860]